MLIAWLEKQQQENAGEMELADLEGFYRDRAPKKQLVHFELTAFFVIYNVIFGI